MHAPVPSAELDKDKLKSLTQRFWHTAKGFWTGEQRRIAWTMTVILIVLVIIQLVISYQLNVWNRIFSTPWRRRMARRCCGRR